MWGTGTPKNRDEVKSRLDGNPANVVGVEESPHLYIDTSIYIYIHILHIYTHIMYTHIYYICDYVYTYILYLDCNFSNAVVIR